MNSAGAKINWKTSQNWFLAWSDLHQNNKKKKKKTKKTKKKKTEVYPGKHNQLE